VKSAFKPKHLFKQKENHKEQGPNIKSVE